MATVSGTNTEYKPLVGTEEATIDSRGRVLLSKKKRERLGESFAMALGEVGCVCIYPEYRWQQMMDEINKYPPSNLGRIKYTRLVLPGSDDDLNCDPQGRVVIPKKLQELGKLSTEVLLVGCGDRIEIWDPAEYEKYEKDVDNYGVDRRNSWKSYRDEMIGDAAPRA
jgi:MraZ protein